MPGPSCEAKNYLVSKIMWPGKAACRVKAPAFQIPLRNVCVKRYSECGRFFVFMIGKMSGSAMQAAVLKAETLDLAAQTQRPILIVGTGPVGVHTARELLALNYWSTQQLLPKRVRKAGSISA